MTDLSRTATIRIKTCREIACEEQRRGGNHKFWRDLARGYVTILRQLRSAM